MIIWGINADNHDASIAVVDSESKNILFAGHAERYSRIKNDSHLNNGLINDAMGWGAPDQIVWYENPWGRRARYIRAGQYKNLLEPFPKTYLKQFGITAPIAYSDHHQSHAAGGFFTSGFNEATCVVIDAIGELTTASVWHAKGRELKKIWSTRYPTSLGLFYSSITQLVGLKPNEEEYILMGMAAHGKNTFDLEHLLELNLHRGARGLVEINGEQEKFDLAASAQLLITQKILQIFESAIQMTGCRNVVYSGGVALNCLANKTIVDVLGLSDLWIMPNPGDAGNALGAIANYLSEPLNWQTPFLGHNIPTSLNPDDVVDELLKNDMCGVATGRAEFGPRALGNRSLLANPLNPNIKDVLNAIKKRQQFRPFAPAVLDRFKFDYFKFPGELVRTPYMQIVCDVLGKVESTMSHVDGTARVQTVDHESPNLEAILERWYAKTGCPVLINTSLNIKGEPLVNTLEDGQRFSTNYGVKVFH